MDNLEHFKLHQDLVEKILHSPEVEEKSKKAKQTPAFRKKMSTRMQQPETKEVLSANARKQREDEDYKTYMSLKWQYFYKTNEKYRNKNNKLLRTPEFRTKRKESYNKTYLNKALKIMKQVFDKHNEINEQAYNKLRKEINDRSIIRIDTIKERFFEGNEEKLKEAVKNYNHKIIRIEKVEEKHDVYDIEVPNTHNFALANGIFVHNSAKQGRDRETQAILPLFGKPLNTEKARLDKTVTDEKLKNLVLALGTGIGDHYDPTKLRYHKLIIMADADVDGYHIATLYLTFFYRHMKELVETGRIFMAMPPLYKATWGKEKRYLFDDTELDKFKKTKEAEKAVIQRFKGLGEMNDEELWETTMNPQTRKLKRIDIEDAAYADEVFTMLMGEEVAPRKKYIMAHAKEAQVDQ